MIKKLFLAASLLFLSGCPFNNAPLALADFCNFGPQSRDKQKCLKSFAVCTEQELGNMHLTSAHPCDLAKSEACKKACFELYEPKPEEKSCSPFDKKYFAETNFSLAKHLKEYPFPLDPTKVTLAYNGSNAEYVIYKDAKDQDATDLQTYENLFKTPKELLRLFLSSNHEEGLEQELKKANLKWLKIPKTLYDILYWSFRWNYAVNLYDKIVNDTSISDDEKNKFKDKQGFPLKYKNDVLALPSISGEILNGPITRDGLISLINEDLENNQAYLKANYALNNYIYRFIKEKGAFNNISKNTLSYATYLKLFEDALQNIQTLFQNNKDKISVMYKSYGIVTRQQFLVSPNNKENAFVKDLFQHSLWLEYSLPKDIYLVYRGSSAKDDVFKGDNPNSLSYGSSWLASIDHDREATAVQYLKNYKGLYAQFIAIPLENKLTNSLFFLLPYSGIIKFELDGEYLHPRSKIFDPNKLGHVDGMNYSDSNTVPYIHTDYNLFKNREDFVDYMKCYFKINRLSIPLYQGN